MTRKHFEAIAAIIANRMAWDDYDDMMAQAHRKTANNLADYFEGENPRFDRDRFLKACGIV